MKKQLSVLLFILSLIFLIPGITQPLLTIKASVNKQEMVELAAELILSEDNKNTFIQSMVQSVLQQLNLQGQVEVFESTRSLLGTINQLISHGHIFVGLLVGVFGLIIPVIKIALILIAFLPTQPEIKRRLINISSLLSKWSMSVVYVMAIFVAFLAINANEQSIDPVQMQAKLGSGFYFFAAYCLLAIAANQLLEQKVK